MTFYIIYKGLMIFTLISSGRRSDYPQTDVQITRTPGVRVFSGGSSPSSSVRVLQSESFSPSSSVRVLQSIFHSENHPILPASSPYSVIRKIWWINTSLSSVLIMTKTSPPTPRFQTLL